MAQIRITPQMMKDQATHLGTLKSQHDDNYAAIKNHINNAVVANWDGPAREAFVATFEGHHQQFLKFGQWIDELRQRLESTATQMEAAEAQVKQNVGQTLS